MNPRSTQRYPMLSKQLLAAILAITGSASLHSQVTWSGATNGTWGTDGNWSPATAPTSSDAVTILGPGNVAGTLNINIAAAAAANSINFTNTAATTLTNTTSGANQTLTIGSGGLTTGTGAVTIGSATANQNVNVALAASQTWDVGSGGLTVNNVVSGAGFGLTKSGTGTLTLLGANTYTGATQINEGTLTLKGANALRNFQTNTTVASGATLKWDATGIGGVANNDAMGAVVANSAPNGTYKIDGTGTLLITGNSTDFLGLGGNSSKKVEFAMGSGGLIDIQGGNLRNGGFQGGIWTNNKADLNIASGAAFDIWDGNAVFVDALTGSGNVINSSNNSANKTLTVGVDNGSGTFNGNIGVTPGSTTRAGINHIALTKNGTGTQILTGTNTYVGATTINGGTLQIGNGGTTGSITNTTGVTNNGILAYNRSDSLTVGYAISGSGALNQIGTGTTTLTNTNTYSGATNITKGTLVVSGTGSINGSSGVIINGSGAKFVKTSSVNGTSPITLTEGTLDGTGTLGAVTVADLAGNVVQHGNGGTSSLTLASLTFNGEATVNIAHSGTTDIAGIFVTNDLVTTPSSGKVTINASVVGSWSQATYNLIQFGNFIGSLTDFTKGTISGLTSRQSASLGLDEIDNFLTLIIAGDNPRWSGLDSGSWVVGNTGGSSNWKLITSEDATDYIEEDAVFFTDAAEGATTVNISAADVSPTAVNFDNSDKNYSLTSTGGFGITGTASLTKTGTGTVTISTINDYSGGTNINGGTLALDGDGTLGSGTVTLGGGTLDLGGGSSSVGSVSITAAASGNTIQNGTLTPTSLTASNAFGNAIIAANIEGSSGVTMSGTGTLTLSGANTYTGGTTVGNGTLVLANGGSLSTSNTLTLGSASGDTSGIFQLGDSSGVANTTVTNIATAGAGTANAVVGGNSSVSTLTINNSSALSYSGKLGGAGTNQNNLALVKSGSGTLTLSGANTHSGGTTLNAGTLVVANNSALGTGTATLNGGTLKASGGRTLANAFNVTATSTIDIAANNTTISGNIGGSSALNLTNSGGAATLTFSGDNSGYSGTITANTNNALNFTSANAGSANAAWVFNDGAGDRVRINIAGGGTLHFGSIAGVGQMQNNTANTTSTISVGALNTSTTFSGTMKDNGTGILALTKVGSGTLTLSGASAYTGATTVNDGTLAIGAADRISDSSALVLGGGTFATGGFSETLGTLTVSSASFLDFGSGTSALVFADSSEITWNGTVTLLNFDIGTDSLKFGSSISALGLEQLSKIHLAGYIASLDSSGFVTFTASAVPEPSTFAALAGLAGLGFAASRRRRLAA